MLLTGATFLSKFLGMIYVIPFNSLVGNEGGVLYNFAYIPYNILISISTVGVPLAVSKFVSKYNSLGDYRTGVRMFKAGTILMAITGFIAFLLLFFAAGPIASLIGLEENGDITLHDATVVIRMISFALLIIPAMSIVRGFFQGYQSMGPTAVSQVVEQIIRIVFLLVAAYIVLHVFDGSIVTAVGFATFAAFIGAIGSCVVLWWYWRRRKSHIENNIQKQKVNNDIPLRSLFNELLRYAGPFVLVGLATSLYQLVDEFTFTRAMIAAGLKDEWVISLAAINMYGHKVILIPVSLATGLSLAILPALTETFTKKNKPLLFQQINQALQVIAVLVIPAVFGLLVLSHETYGALFGGMKSLDITGTLLAWYAPVALLFALFTVSASLLQGINEQRFAVISLTAGLLVKVLFNIELIHIFGAKGAIFGTALAAGIATALNLWRMQRAVRFSFKQTLKRTILVLIFSTFMIAVIWILKWLIGMILPFETSRMAAVIMLIVGVVAGGAVYLWLAYSSTLLERVLGSRVRILDRFFHRS